MKIWISSKSRSNEFSNKHFSSNRFAPNRIASHRVTAFLTTPPIALPTPFILLTTLPTLLLLLVLIIHSLALLRVILIMLLLIDRLLHDLDHILILQHMRQPTMLRTVLRAGSPHQRIAKLLQQVLRDLRDGALHSESVSILAENDGLVEGRRLGSALRVDSKQPHVLPDQLENRIHVEIEANRADRAVRETSKPIHVLNADRIDFVVHLEPLDVLPIAFDHVDQLVHAIIVPENHFRVVDSVLALTHPHTLTSCNIL